MKSLIIMMIMTVGKEYEKEEWGRGGVLDDVTDKHGI